MIFQLIIVIVIVLLGEVLISRESKKLNINNSKLITENPQIRNFLIRFSSFILIVQSGLRNYAVGDDTFQYFNRFETVNHQSWAEIFDNFYVVYYLGEGKDAGYDLFQKIFQIFSENYTVYLLIVAFIFFYSLGKFINENCNGIRQVIFAFVLYQALYYEFFSITGIRQTLATAFTLFGFQYLKERKLFKFILIVIIGAFLHKSALLFLPFFFIGNIKKSLYLYILSIIIFPLIMHYRRLIAFLIAFASNSENYMNFALSDIKSGTPVFTFLMVLVMIGGLIYFKKVINNFPDSYRYFNALAIAFFFTPLTWVDPSLMRVVQYFSIFILILIPMIIDVISTFDNRVNRLLYLVLYLILILFIIKKGYEYKFFWEFMPLGSNY